MCFGTAAVTLLPGGAPSRGARSSTDAIPPASAAGASPSPGSSTAGSTADSTAGSTTDTAAPAISEVTGAVVVRQSNGSWQPRCSGGVVDSTSGDVVVTAAHCLYSGGVLAFAPGYRAGSMPHGLWPVTSTHTDPAWQDHADPDDDYAFLAVSPPSGHPGTLEAAVGALTLGLSPLVGDVVTVRGYPYTANGQALTCQAQIRSTAGFPTVDCEHFAAGTSGAPLVRDGDEVVGVIGGLDTGGCTDDVSYASPFTARTRLVLVAAERRAPSSPPTQTPPHENC